MKTKQLNRKVKNSIFLYFKLCLVGMLIIGILAASGCITRKPTVSQESVKHNFSEFESKYKEKQSQGYDVTEAEELAKKAKQAYDKGDYESANKLLDDAFMALETAKIPTIPATTPVTIEAPTQPIQKGWINDGPIYIVYPYDVTEKGSFKGLTEKIPYLKELGINTIYLMPIFDHVGKLPYSVKDYYKISPYHGTEADLHELVDTVHNNDMKIIFDLVISYLPLESKLYKEHSDWFLQDKKGKVLNHYPHPKWGLAIDRGNSKIQEYFAEVAKYYVQEYDIDGWRIDAPQNNYDSKIVSGDHSATELLRKVKQSITSVKPNAILLTEYPGPLCEENTECDPLFDEMSEISYDWELRPWVYKNVLQNGGATSQDLVDLLNNQKIWYGRTRARYIESQDTHRIQELLNKVNKPDANKPLAVLISTIPGVPMIQVGQEIGEVRTKKTVNWDDGDYELRDFYKKVFEIRRDSPSLKYGNLSNVWKSGDNTYAYLRSYKDNNVVIILNFQNKEFKSTLDLPFKVGSTLDDVLNNENFKVDNPSNFEISVPAYGARIMVLQKEGK